MDHLKVLIVFLVWLHHITAAPRYLSSSSEQESGVPESDGWLFPGLESNPFFSLMGTRRQRQLPASNRHDIQKRKCNTATCVTQRLADFLVRSSNTIGTVYAPTNVGSDAYGKRQLLLTPPHLHLKYPNPPHLHI